MTCTNISNLCVNSEVYSVMHAKLNNIFINECKNTDMDYFFIIKNSVIAHKAWCYTQT